MFLEDRSLQSLSTKEALWIELVNYGYRLGDRILTKTNPNLYGSDVEELQELLSRLGFYSEPINGVFTKQVVSAVIKFQENRGLAIDGAVGLNTVDEIKRLIRPGFDTSLNEAIKTISPNFLSGNIGYSVSFNIRLCQVLENLVGVGKSKLYFIELNEWGCAGVWRRPVFFRLLI